MNADFSSERNKAPLTTTTPWTSNHALQYNSNHSNHSNSTRSVLSLEETCVPPFPAPPTVRSAVQYWEKTTAVPLSPAPVSPERRKTVHSVPFLVLQTTSTIPTVPPLSPSPRFLRKSLLVPVNESKAVKSINDHDKLKHNNNNNNKTKETTTTTTLPPPPPFLIRKSPIVRVSDSKEANSNSNNNDDHVRKTIPTVPLSPSPQFLRKSLLVPVNESKAAKNNKNNDGDDQPKKIKDKLNKSNNNNNNNNKIFTVEAPISVVVKESTTTTTTTLPPPPLPIRKSLRVLVNDNKEVNDDDNDDQHKKKDKHNDDKQLQQQQLLTKDKSLSQVVADNNTTCHNDNNKVNKQKHNDDKKKKKKKKILPVEADNNNNGTNDHKRQLVLPYELPKSPKDFKRLVALGEGSFGQVWLVTAACSLSTKDKAATPTTKATATKITKSKAKPRRFALKIQAKHDLLASGTAWAALREKQILQELQPHPFINRLYQTYQDDDFLYSVLEFVQGGELFTVMHNHDSGDAIRLPESQAKFYALAIADALVYMHRRMIVYRDMKPENVMIDEHGYPIIIDMGLAKKIDDADKTKMTFTLCGTPRYMAPEMVATSGHDCRADNWSLGILIYEMVTGENPFFFEGQEEMMLFHSIVNDPPEPPRGVSADAHDIIDKLLIKDPAQRLGSRKKSDITKHAWFTPALDLHAMRKRKVPAPWVPKLKDKLDCSRFDDYSDTADDKTRHAMPRVSARDQRQFEGF